MFRDSQFPPLHRGVGGPLRVAVVGSGIAGLAAAHTLRDHAQVTLFEADHRFGGHAHTVDVTLPVAGRMVSHGVDTGFLVLNERTYPNLLNLFAELQVPLAASDMSFSVQVPQGPQGQALEWSGSSLDSVFAQRANLLRPAFWGMLRDILRFNRAATELAQDHADERLHLPLEDWLVREGYGRAFIDWYLLPMLGCIWSCPTGQMLAFPVATMVRFCHNHGLLQISGRPQWHTVTGGSRRYVQRIVQGLGDCRLNSPVRAVRRAPDGVRVVTDGRIEHFDELVLACHSDQALALLGAEATLLEHELLGAIRYQANEAVLHTDASVLPRQRKAWAAWNHERAGDPQAESAGVCLHYLINRLQPLPFTQPVLVSLNPIRPIAEAAVIGRYRYAHPVFDLGAIHAQQRMERIQGQLHTHFCGAWTGYGFHEDGLKSGLQAARRILSRLPQTHPEGAH